MKKVLFWTTVVPYGFVWLIALFVSLPLGRWGDGAVEVIETVLRRWELWCFDIARGTFYNCPWKYTLKQVWRNEIQ